MCHVSVMCDYEELYGAGAYYEETLTVGVKSYASFGAAMAKCDKGSQKIYL